MPLLSVLSDKTASLLLIVLITILWPRSPARSVTMTSSDEHWVLVNQGKSAYSILVPVSAAAPEKFAAEELQRYLFEITSVRLSITSVGSGHVIQLGLDPKVSWYGLLKSLN